MADDIVTRLRQRAIYRMNPIAKAVGLGIDDFIETEAADEIERLRKSGKELLDALTEMAEKGIMPKITIRLRDAGQTFEQVVRGEQER